MCATATTLELVNIEQHPVLKDKRKYHKLALTPGRRVLVVLQARNGTQNPQWMFVHESLSYSVLASPINRKGQPTYKPVFRIYQEHVLGCLVKSGCNNS